MVHRSTARNWGAFSVWALLGEAGSFGFLALGVLAAIPVALAGWLLIRRAELRRSAFGVLSGVGAILLVVAYVQRRGPGTVCWQTATRSGCDEYLNPWPWLVVGVVLLAAGLIAHARRLRPRP
jgi:hypothetical protein